MADKCIGNLTLNTTGVKKAIEEVNKMLADIGVGKKVNISSKVTAAVKESLKDVENLIKQSEQKISEAAAKATKSIENIGKTKTDNTSQINKLAQAYKELYDVQRKAESSKQQKNMDNVAYYQGLAGAIQQKINKQLEEIETSGKSAAAAEKEAQAIQSVVNAKRALTAAKNTTENKAQQEEAKEVENATKAYIKLLEAKSKVKQLETQGKQDTEEYVKATQSAGKAYDAFIKYSQGARDAAKASKEAAQARRDLNEVESKVTEDTSKVDYLAKIKQQYFELTDAIKNYNAAKKAGDDNGMAVAQSRIDAAMQEVSAIQEAVNASNLEAGAKQQVLNYIQQCVTAEHQHTAEIGKSVSQTSELDSQVNGLVTRYLSLAAVIRTISNLTKNMVEYVSDYSQKMNEIQMITLKSDEEVASLSDRYREIAKEMNASTLDIADAAIYFTRQGLAAKDIEDRLINVTKYAKAANVEFTNASEIITSVINSMGLLDNQLGDGRTAAERVADVFLNIGDNAATSGQEIGEAMQKAAASAGSFGVSMEWLASYIATVSETTRQEARTIGTAFNTIIARLHNIKQNGYNQEDETRVNDIAKALSNINVALMDQEGNWRPMETILEDIAKEWGDLDDKTKSYIATTMAGVKQQNVFLALMNDMSKGIENGSRAFELHELAMESDGTASEKYAVHLDSVAAAQERLTIAQEGFYALLNQDVIKGWYDNLAGIVTYITNATEAMHGLNIIIPLVAAGIYLIVAAVQSFTAAAAKAGGVMILLGKHPVILAISAAIIAITTLTGVVGAFTQKTDGMAEAFDHANERLKASQKNLANYTKIQSDANKMFADLGDGAKMSAENVEKYNGTLEDIASISPVAKHVVDELKAGFISQKEAAEQLNAELDRLAENEKKVSMRNLMQRYANYQNESATTSDTAKLVKLAQDETMMALNRGDRREAFKGSIQYNYMNNNFSEDMQKYIKELVDSYSKTYNASETWDLITGDIIYSLFGDFNIPDDVTKSLVDQVEGEIDKVMSVIGSDLDPAEFKALRKSLHDAIFGADAEAGGDPFSLSAEDYKDFSKSILYWLSDFTRNGKDAIVDEIGDVNFAEIIASSLFDESYYNDLFMDRGEEFSRNFVDQYKQLIAAGFTDNEIKDLLTTIGQPMWDSAVDVLRNRTLDAIKEAFGSDFLGAAIRDANLNVVDVNELMWGQLDLKTLEKIQGLAQSGVLDMSDVNVMMIQAKGSVEAFTVALDNYGKEVGFVEEEVDNADNLFPQVDHLENITKAQEEIDKLTKHIDALASGDKVSISDLLELAKSHPEIMSTIGDLDALKQKLEEIRGKKRESQKGDMMEIMLDSKELFASRQSSRSAVAQESGATTYREYIEALRDRGYEETIRGVKNGLEGLVGVYMGLEGAEGEANEKFKETLEILKNYQSELKTLDGYIKDLTDNKGLSNADFLSLATAHPELTAYMNDLDVLKAKLVELREKTATESKESVKNALMDSTDFFANSPFRNAQFGGEKVSTMQEYMDKLQAGSNDYKEASEYVEEASQNLVEGAEALNTAADTWLVAQQKIIEANQDANWAKTNGYGEQIDGLLASLESGGAEGALATFNEYMGANQEIVKGMASEYPILIERLADAETAQTRYNEAVKKYGENSDEAKEAMGDLEDAASGVESELKRVQKYLSTKYFKDTAKAAKDLAEGTVSVDDAYEQLNKDLNKVSKAYEDVADVNKKMDEGVDPTVQDVSNLASVLGMSAESILADWPAALDLFNGLTSSTGALQSAINALNDAAFIRITGTSDADFSAIQAGLISVQNLADDAVAKLQATGQWTTETIDLPQEAAVWHPDVDGGGYWSTETMTAGATVLKPTGNNPFSGGGGGGGGGKSGGGGGGGGGGSKSSNKSGMTKVEKMLDMMSQVKAIQDYQRSYYQAQNKYYDQTGELQGVIGYSQREIDVLTEQNKTLESNIAEIEKWMAKKSKELSKLKTSSDKYEEVADDLDKLQKAHQEYTNQLIDNATAIDKLKEEIEEVRKQIRQMEIELRKTILKAIEDREAKARKMLESEIEMENTILDLIKRRYEKERDDIIRTTDMKIAALEEERDLLDEQLQLRRQQAEEEDKAAKLKELELKYQRIIADPTRAKEAQQLRQEIDDLREEMAWDTAEKEIKAQQDSIDQQITSLEDYEEYINNYYEDLFEHPEKLIDEMREIMMMTQDEILAWLKENDEEYQIASENTRKKMVEDWTQMYEDMKGIIKTYWDEVEKIIAKGDAYIIQFLKDNSEDYAKAGKLQAEAYVDEWKKQLEDLKKAYKQVQTQAASSYQTIKKATGSSSSSSGGGSSSSGGGSSPKGGGGGGTKYYLGWVQGTYSTGAVSNHKDKSTVSAQDAANKAKSHFTNTGMIVSYTDKTETTTDKTKYDNWLVFKKGGLADYTGPAWVDGTERDPERILTPYQTKLFESMVQALEQMNKLYVPSMPNFGGLESTGANPVSVGDIIVNVDNLDTDEDYEELARKVGEVLMDEIGRTAVIGGLRIRSI